MLRCPRLTISGLSGGAGKSIVSLGLTRAWVQEGLILKPYKKGPDYIDATWLGLAARSTSTNLDPYLFSPQTLADLFAHSCKGADLCIIEGNRGLFDGLDIQGTCSTAQVARLIGSPVVLVLDATKMTRTAAAIVHGVKTFEPEIRLAGVILNRIAGPRHESMARETIETLAGTPVLGALPKLDPDPIPERHMGLISDQEFTTAEPVLDRLAEIMRANLDMKALLQAAQQAPDLPEPGELPWPKNAIPQEKTTIGYVHDSVLWFYYQENLEALRKAGAELIRLTLFDDKPWPEIHGLYLGGGFPETHAQAIVKNRKVLEKIRNLAEAGMPIYAECGGFMLLAQSLLLEDFEYPMAGVLPVKTSFCAKPQGLGYVEAESMGKNPFHPPGTILKGHEFHYSLCLAPDRRELEFLLRLKRGRGMLGGLDGLAHKNTFACYTHIHALGAPHWAENFARAAARWRAERSV